MLSIKTKTLPFWQNYKLGALLILVLLFLLAYNTGLFVMPSTNAADDPTEPIPGSSVSGPSTLSVSITDSIALDLTPISSNGTFATTSTTDTNISVSTNHFTGYTLTMSANELGTNALVNDVLDNNDNVVASYSIPSVTSSVSEQDYKDDTYTSEHDLNNTYGFRPSTLYNATTGTTETNNNYLPVPNNDDIEDIVIAKTTTANNIDSSTGNRTVDNYNMAIGSRVDTTTVTGEYKNTFVITAVTNPTPYTINYNKNTTDTVTNMPESTSGSTMGNTIQISSNTPTRDNYTFKGWCTAPVQDGTTCDTPYTQYDKGSTYELDQTAGNSNITLYAIWNPTLTFVAGDNIETVIVADSSENFKPYYATAGNPVTFTDVPANRKFIVTVVPNPNYKLDDTNPWTSTAINNTSTFDNNTNLTTNFYSGNKAETLTANGISGSYTSMQSFSTCTAEGNNVTDIRDGKSYTVAKLGNYCYMLSNLRLDSTTDGTTPRVLTSADSDITPNDTYSTFTMPSDGWIKNDGYNYNCKAAMIKNGDYYYNWYAAIANPYQCPSDVEDMSAKDDLALGSICPAGWTLPTRETFISSEDLWQDGENSGMMMAPGYYSAGLTDRGTVDWWWFSGPAGSSGQLAPYQVFNSVNGTVVRATVHRYNGNSVRCIRSN